MLETFNNDKSNLETPWVAYIEENSTIYYSVDDVIKYRILCIRQKDISNITYEAVDLGLPSGLKWADRNVGAASPEDFGSYFQWGDTNANTFDGEGEISAVKLAELLNPLFGPALDMEITTDNVGMILEQFGIIGTDLINNIEEPFCLSLNKFFFEDSYFDKDYEKYNNEGLKVLESVDDAATIHMGSNYRMPTIDEINELINNTTHTFIDLDGNEYSQEQTKNGAIEARKLKGVRFTGSNDNSIFIPATGYCFQCLLDDFNADSSLWSSSLDDTVDAMFLSFSYDGNINKSSNFRYYGRSVRGVLN